MNYSSVQRLLRDGSGMPPVVYSILNILAACSTSTQRTHEWGCESSTLAQSSGVLAPVSIIRKCKQFLEIVDLRMEQGLPFVAGEWFFFWLCGEVGPGTEFCKPPRTSS